MKRRAVVLGTVGLASLAGCLSGDDEGESEIDGYERGEIEVVVDGSPVDLEADRFQAEHADDHSIAFHFHEGDEYWYMEGDRRLTFAEGIDRIPHFEYDRVDGEHVVTVDGTRYDGADPGTELTFLVDGDAVDPTDRDLHDGDALRLEIATDG